MRDCVAWRVDGSIIGCRAARLGRRSFPQDCDAWSECLRGGESVSRFPCVVRVGLVCMRQGEKGSNQGLVEPALGIE